MNVSQSIRYGRSGQLHVDGAQVTASLRGLVHQVQVRPRDRNGFLHYLSLGEYNWTSRHTTDYLWHPCAGYYGRKDEGIVVFAGFDHISVWTEERTRNTREVDGWVSGQETEIRNWYLLNMSSRWKDQATKYMKNGWVLVSLNHLYCFLVDLYTLNKKI